METTSPDRRQALVALLALLAVLAGCADLAELTGSEPATTVDPEDGRQATVTHVVDADTVDVRFADGSEDRVRLLGIDVPETQAENQPGEFEGVSDTAAARQCLHDAGVTATEEVVRPRIEGEVVNVVTDDAADRRGGFDRLLAYIVHDEENLNYLLVERGHARVYDSTFSQSERFYDAESAARDEILGLWQCTNVGVPAMGVAA